MNPYPVIRITGASAGIGKATAKLFCQKGWTVFAGARRAERMEDLRQMGCHVLPLDVTHEESCQLFVRPMRLKVNRMDILVNNAGYGLMGPLEELPLPDVRAQLETNVLGLLHMTQLVLPSMRQQQHGRIILIGSRRRAVCCPRRRRLPHEQVHSGGLSRLATRRGQGIQHPGIAAGTRRRAYRFYQYLGGYHACRCARKSLYPVQATDDSERTALFEPGNPAVVDVDVVTNVIWHAATARRPRTRYRVGLVAKILPIVRRLMGDRNWDSFAWNQAMAEPKPAKTKGISVPTTNTSRQGAHP